MILRSNCLALMRRGMASAFMMLASYACACAGSQLGKVTPNGTRLLVYTPEAYDRKAIKFPLLIFLHSEEMAGDDLQMLMSKSTHDIPSKLISSGRWDKNLPFIVVSPQVRKTSLKTTPFWSAAYINDVMAFVKDNYRVDDTRVYLTGVSIGATACWKYAATYPEKVAAIIPVAGFADKNNITGLKSVAIWAFHGENDPADVRSSVEVANLTKSSKANFIPRLTLLPSKTREGWSGLYNGQSGYPLYAWLLKFRKGHSGNVPPYVYAGRNTITVRPGTHHLAGDYFDWDGKITSANWKQVAGSPLLLPNSQSAILTLSDLKEGNYEFELRVGDNAGATASSRVRVIVAPPSVGPAITGLVLMNGKTNTDLVRIQDGTVVDKTSFGTEFNVRANVSAGVKSVRFSINSDLTTRIVSHAPFLIRKQSSSPEWVPNNGSCVICATPYADLSARGKEGATKCYKVVFSEATTTNSFAATEVPLKVRAIDNILVSNMSSGNQWVCNGKDIAGATGPIFQPLYPGKYYVRHALRTSFDVSNIVTYGALPENVISTPIAVVPHPEEGFIQVNAESLPLKSSYRIMKGDVTVQQGELFENKIELTSPLPKGDYRLIVNGRKDDEGTKFRIR